jgi:plasmid stabilization system protein ParE
MKVRFHPAARRELLKHNRWYFVRSPSAALGFEREIDHAISRISEAPERYVLTFHGCRRFALLRYPFTIVYRILRDEIEIIAVAHGRRRRGYWTRRA